MTQNPLRWALAPKALLSAVSLVALSSHVVAMPLSPRLSKGLADAPIVWGAEISATAKAPRLMPGSIEENPPVPGTGVSQADESLDNSSASSEATPSAQANAPLSFAGEAVPLHDRSFRTRYARQIAQAYRNNANAQRLYARAEQWLPRFRAVFAEYGIPADFVYLSVVESGLTNASARSGAAGFWQLMPGTARAYGLSRQGRMDPMASCRATARYLKACYKELGSWTLVAAAYNIGTGKLHSAMRQQGTRDYYQLRLNGQTEEFLPRLVAYKQIFERPEAFGLKGSGKRVPLADLMPRAPLAKASKGAKVKNAGFTVRPNVKKGKSFGLAQVRLTRDMVNTEAEIQALEDSLKLSHELFDLLNPNLTTLMTLDGEEKGEIELNYLLIPEDATLEMAEDYVRFTLGLTDDPLRAERRDDQLTEEEATLYGTTKHAITSYVAPENEAQTEEERRNTKRQQRALAWAKLLCAATLNEQFMHGSSAVVNTPTPLPLA